MASPQGPVDDRASPAYINGTGASARHAVKTHCKRGHEFTPKNTRTVRGARWCRECGRAACRAARVKSRDLGPGVES